MTTQTFTTKTSLLREMKNKSNEKKYTPWTAPWMHIHFHYTGYIEDDSHLSPVEQEKEPEVRKRVYSFAHQRKNYRYQLIANNARDLGDYYTKDGHKTKTGLLIRSDNLHNLDYFGAKVLQRLNVNNVIDLRSLHESHQAFDNIPSYMIHNIPVYTAKGVNRSRNLTFRYGVIYRYGTLFLTNPHAQIAYKRALKSFAANNGANLFHCVEGRDRTGLVAVLILSALNVDKQTIINDYLLTDYYAHTKPYIKQLEQIEHFYNEVNKLYGGIYGYLHYIGITSHDIHTLRAKYVK